MPRLPPSIEFVAEFCILGATSQVEEVYVGLPKEFVVKKRSVAAAGESKTNLFTADSGRAKHDVNANRARDLCENGAFHYGCEKRSYCINSRWLYLEICWSS